MNELNIEAEIALLKNNQENLTEKVETLTTRVDHHDNIYGIINKMSTNIEVMCEQMKNMKTDITSVKGDVSSVKGELNEIKSKPGKNWEKFLWAVGGGIVAAILGFVMTHIGISV